MLPERADQLAARGFDGDRSALSELLAAPELLAPPRFATSIPALALEAKRLGLEIPVLWQRSLLATAVSGMLLKAQLDGVGKVLDSADIPWMPIKGMDLGYRLWPGPECRPTSDLDVLVPIARFAESRAALVEAGWRGLEHGDAYEDYLESEAYNWEAQNESGILLELHFRLWPSAPADWAESLWGRSIEAPELGSKARRPDWADAFVMAAVHLWQLPPPHKLVYFRDLELIARRGGEPALEAAAASARRWGLSLQVSLAALYSASLWPSPAMLRLARYLQEDLHLPERVLFERAVSRGTDAASIGELWIARLLAGRNTRHGWKVVWRRIRPHPALQNRRAADHPGIVRSAREP